ncbi:MFS transporter [Catellatospora sp. TT07R-123]|uniref:MFS transporter n=1 Tax=Catellatospora sp. TT07R-123 TaxID=2733863 RepID=UPI001B1B9022|nr:MFS transporter [Catellatospora sp. TT07R-123]GHJ44211.1 MFS transporter [Catellatospora sp. TT07R-123]
MQGANPTEASPLAGKREWIGLAVLALPTLLGALDIGALYLALPHLSVDLHTTSTQQLWVADIYGFLTAGLLVTMGTLGDRIGRRKLLLIGGFMFGVLSVVAAYSSSAEMLIVSRALLGIAGATLMPSTLALITNMFRNDRQRGTAIATWVSCMMTGAAIGPVVGGLMLNHWWWGSVFLLGVPVMVLLLVVGPILLPEYKNPGSGRLDLFSVALSVAAILLLIYGLKELAVHGADKPLTTFGALVLGAVIMFVFIRRQLGLTSPLLDLRLFANPTFRVTLLSLLLAAAAMAGAFLLSSQYVQTVLGFSPPKAGLWLLPAGVSIAIGAQFGPLLTRKLRPPVVITLGLLVAVVGWVLIALVSGDGGLPQIVVGLILIHIGAGPLFALGTYLVVGSVPPERAGSAASLSETANTFGSTFGIALMGTIGAAIYVSQMSSADLGGLAPAQADLARDTVVGAAQAATQLPADGAQALLSKAHDAFTSGMNVAAIVGAVVFLGIALLLSYMNRPRPAAVPAQSGAPAEAPAEQAALG